MRWVATCLLLVACSKSTPATLADAATAPAPELEVSASEVIAPGDAAVAPAEVDSGAAGVTTPDAAPTLGVGDTGVPDALVAAVGDTRSATIAGALGATEKAAEAPVAARPVPPTGVYASAEDALLAYIEGTRRQDPERLWSVMTGSARKVMDQVVVKARATPEGELAKIGLTPAMLVDITPRAFFDHMVRQAPKPDAAELAEAVHDLVTTPDGPERAKVTFGLGKTSCVADTAKDSEGWKVEVSRCTGP